MKKILLYICVIVFVSCTNSLGGESADEKSKQNIIEKIINNELDDDLWYGIYVDDAKVGWINWKSFLKKDVFVEILEFISITKFEGQIETISNKYVAEFDSKPPYFILKYSGTTTNENQYFSLIEGNRKNDDFVVEFEEGKSKRIKTLKNLDYSLYDLLAMSIWLFNVPQIGDKINSREYIFDELRYMNMQSEIFDYKESKIDGVILPYYTIKHLLEIEESEELVIAYDFIGTNGLPLKFTIGSTEFRLETKKEAENIDYVSNLFLENIIKMENRLPDLITSTDTNKIIFKINGDYTADFYEGSGQKIVNLSDGNKKLILYDIGDNFSHLDKASFSEYDLYSKETPIYPYTDPIIRTLINTIPRSSDSVDGIFNIIEFVNKYVEGDYQANAVSVFDVIRTKKGDCTEYSLLFATLAKGMGYAVKEVSGWAYSEEDNGYVGHAWNEIIISIGNKLFWLPVDSTYNEIDPFHIKAKNDYSTNNLPSLRLIETVHENGKITRYYD